MAAINLSADEATVLHDVVRNYLSELHTEISHTDDREFKAALKRRQALLGEIVERLGTVLEQPA